ncbi:hypothetical protein ACIQPP_05425 [Streptomyces violaceusniger]|uniref:hypothetical protein n=1 Tax=Streptomyces violaceusniger TaxID=68280 RepID=UPI0009C1F08D|nr:hypothetical protein [Streptomyces hygroscopicus]AQW55261.1 hypothetical protein SHXM_08724 [Streptomyces hygroscopicus]
MTTLSPAVSDVLTERARQDEKWGEQNHDPEVWLAIAGEEFGELAQAILARRFGAAEHSSHNTGVRAEAVQLAAVAVALVECLDRNAEPVTPPADMVGSLALRRAVEIAVGTPVPCPQCSRRTPCRCVASRNEGRVEAIVAAIRPWLRLDDEPGRESS